MTIRWAALAVLLAGSASAAPQFPLSDLERASGWVSMSDPTSRSGWGELPKGWTFDGPILRRAAKTPESLVWKDVLSEFEIDFEWREYPIGELGWVSGRVVMRRDDSALALLGDQRIDRAANSVLPSFRAGVFELTPAQSKPGWHISLRPGDTEVELRSVHLRDRGQSIGKRIELFDGKSLKGWRALGDAKFTVENGELIGEVGGGSQSFLCTEQEFGDFIFEVDVKNELPGNSGIQVRSHENDAHRLFGYQIEIDPSSRAWSGGLYDEARRGWLDDLSDNPQGRAAFKSGEWNHYQIECIGPWIRAWVNDVPTSDYLDVKDLAGVIGLQVHAGKDTKVRWRNVRLHQLGQSSWHDIDRRKSPRMLYYGANDSFLGTFNRRDRIALSSQEKRDSDGDLRIRYELFGGEALRFDGKAGALGSEPGAVETIRLILPGPRFWAITADTKAAAPEGGELLILCHPPRVAIEVNGQRLTGLKFDPIDSWAALERHPPLEHGEDVGLHGAEAWIDSWMDLELEKAEYLYRY